MLRLIFNTPAGQSAPARWFAAALAALIWLKRAKDAKKRKLKAKKTDGGAKPTGPIKLVWKDLWPRWFKPGVRGIGSAEMVGIFACQMVRVYINVKLANMVRLGDGLLYTRDWVRYRAFVRYALTVGLLRIIFETIYNQIRDRLSRKWRTKLTTMVHEEYFGSSNYYHVEAKMRDADVRITEDIKMLAEGFTSFFGAATYTATTGIFYSLKVWWEFGLLYMSAPYIYFLFASKMQPLLGRMKWSLYTELEGARAKFRTAHTRLVEHSESIAALRGERTERAILDELFGAVVRAKRKVFKALIPYEASRSLLYEHLLLTMYTTFVIGPGTFRPETVRRPWTPHHSKLSFFDWEAPVHRLFLLRNY
jgi:ATP-binding cassette subfamily D (ALD) protein 3